MLVVDDHPGTTEAVSLLLRLLGEEPHAVQRGADALAAARELEPDLVMLDIGLPDIDGYEVARTLRHELGHRCYIVAATGWGRPLDRARAAAAGFDQHLTKPYDVNAIRELLRLSAAATR
ncbi:MAG TPA: response regulator [Kofleriaceae bacterium]